MNDLQKAKKAFSTVIALDPNYAYAYYALAMANENENNYADAITNYEKFMNLTTDNEMKNQVKNQIEYLKSKNNEKQ